MARITVEDCLKREENRFALVLLAAKRTKQLLSGSAAVAEEERDNKAVVMSLREIAEGKVRFKTEEDLRIEEELAQKEREAELARREAESVSVEPVIESEGSGGDGDSDAEENGAGPAAGDNNSTPV